MALRREDFGSDFIWGVANAAYQVEGAHLTDGKGLSIWDVFSNQKGNTFKDQTANVACDFYNRYPSDINLLHYLHVSNLRFSIAWSRIKPDGIGYVNQHGVDHYDRMIDHLLSMDITPWVTLYHWDLPAALEKKGGWTNREIIHWFAEYVDCVTKRFGDRVKDWMILNEPMVFTGAGYFLGVHAPGRKGLKNFIPAMHHAALCQAEGGRVARNNVPNGQIGTTFSCSYVEPINHSEKNVTAAQRVDALLNRLFIEPSLGMGYPIELNKAFTLLEKHWKAGDENLLVFDFDFIGVQNYTREIVSHSLFTPVLSAKLVSAAKRNVPTTTMGWEVYPKGIYRLLKKFNAYPKVKKIIVTENGAAFDDTVQNGFVHDHRRVEFLQNYISQVKKAKKEGVPVAGYFIWTLTDNFEWSEGYAPRFGIVYTDFETQERIVKSSGHWFREFLMGE